MKAQPGGNKDNESRCKWKSSDQNGIDRIKVIKVGS